MDTDTYDFSGVDEETVISPAVFAACSPWCHDYTPLCFTLNYLHPVRLINKFKIRNQFSWCLVKSYLPLHYPWSFSLAAICGIVRFDRYIAPDVKFYHSPPATTGIPGTSNEQQNLEVQFPRTRYFSAGNIARIIVLNKKRSLRRPHLLFSACLYQRTLFKSTDYLNSKFQLPDIGTRVVLPLTG